MVITVVTVRMVKVTFDQIIDMPAVGHCLVPTPWTVDMTGLVTAAMMVRCTAIRVLVVDFDRVLFDHVRAGDLRMMKVTVMQIVDMAAMFDSDMATVLGVLVSVIGMAFAHGL
jgi:hypothetical protein